jgi:16S rRNA G966 N2-methylase RsmD
MSEFNTALTEVKNAGQDYEWYPTTKNMLSVISNDILRHQKQEYRMRSVSILDIGAGDGNALEIIEQQVSGLHESEIQIYKNDPDTVLREKIEISVKKYAIEKSHVLISKMKNDIFVIGTDFAQQSLIDKKMDIIFSNPPYSDFEYWTAKILKESHASTVYMVIPTRWETDEIKRIIEKRGVEYKVLDTQDFIDSEYRKARAVVDIVKFTFKTIGYSRAENIESDPFKVWFYDHFKINSGTPEAPETRKERIQTKIAGEQKLSTGRNLIEVLHELYTNDMSKLLENYKSLETIDAALMKELGVSLDAVISGLREKITGLKNLYWKELFSNLTKITDRLTVNSREKLLDTLTQNTQIDFSAENAYAVVIWAMKNANKYFESQLINMYRDLSRKENVHGYRSNEKFSTYDWRYARKDFNDTLTHYILDYRIVQEHYTAIYAGDFHTWDYIGNLHSTAHNEIMDICTIGKNLGYNIVTKSSDFEWESGKRYKFVTSEDELFMEVKAHKNGNIHFFLSQEFMRKFNIEAARLLGWVSNKEEAAREMDIPLDEVARCWNQNKQFALTDSRRLLV